MSESLWLPASAELALGREAQALREHDPLERTLMETGLFETGHGFRFRCPICGKAEVADQRMPPACTGPSWTDDHPLEPMELVET